VVLTGLASQPAPDGWKEVLAAGPDSRAVIGTAAEGSAWIALADFEVAESGPAQFLASSSGTLEVWLNGRPVHRRARAGTYAPDSDRFDVELREGLNRFVVQVASAGPAEVHARFRRKSLDERHERLAQLALTTPGSPEHGREVFFNVEKAGCNKCHRLGDQGGRIGPDLTGAGRRFSRIHLVESVLEPSRVVAPAFLNTAVRLRDGQVMVGVKVAETDSALTLGDAQGQSHVVEKSRIKEEQALEQSAMPEGIEKTLTDREFADLIAFLAAQR
jgi:putative heme-binding domain-containing protein